MSDGRLRALLHAQQAHATRNATAQQGSLLHVAHPRECNTQQVGNTPPDPAAEVRRQRVRALLDARPEKQRAVYCDGIPVNGVITIWVGIRYVGGIATADIEVRADRYDGIALLDLVERHSGTLH